MKKFSLLTKSISTLASICLASTMTYAQLGTDQFVIAADVASNYGVTWTGNQGSGFNVWSLNQSGGGHYIGGTGQGTNAFGIYSSGTGSYATAVRSFANGALKPGETFSVDIGHTSNIYGEIGINLRDNNGATRFSLKFTGGDTDWDLNDGFDDFGSGQNFAADTSLTFTFTYEGGNTYSYTFGTGSGSNYVATSDLTNLTGVEFYNVNQGSGENFGFNNLQIESTYTIPNGQSSTASANVSPPYLDIQSGGTLNVNEGIEIDCAGNLTLNGTITLNASASGYAQLKVDGTISGTGTVTLEQRLEAGWHNISSLGSGNAGILGSIGSSNSNPNVQNLFTWDASNSSWNNIVNNSIVISGGDGFTAFVGDNGSFLGVGIADTGIASWTYVADSLVDGNFQPTLSYGAAGAGITYNSGNPQDGWNLIGNPFPCALNLTNALGWGSEVEQSVTIYNPSGSYNTKTNLSPDGVAIAPGQSFWIRTTASTGDLTFPSVNMQNNCDVGQSPTFHKTHNVIADRLFLNAFEAADHSISDNFLLGMVPGTTDDLDIAWDATKRLNVPTFPSLMSVAYGYPLAINAIDYSPNHLKTKKLQLRFVSGKANEVYFIELHDSLLSNNYHIELEDLKLRRKHNLKSAPYKFVHDQNAEYRFVLHISPVTTINQGHTHTPIVSGGVNVGINGGTLVLKMDAPQQDVQGALLDLNGRRVMEVEYPAGADQHEVNVSGLSSGIYLLKLQSPQGEEVRKVILP